MQYNLRRQIAVLILYTSITLLMTAPVMFNANSHVAGSGGDPWQTMWRFENKWDQMSASFVSGDIYNYLVNEFGGQGTPRLVNLTVWPWMLLHIFLGEPLAYNTVWLLSFILAGITMYFHVEYLLNTRINHPFSNNLIGPWDISWPAFIAGLYYMFIPFHIAQAQGHFGAMQIHWLTLAILALFAFTAKPTIIRACLLALAVIIQAWSEHHYFLWFIFFVPVFFLAQPKALSRLFSKASARWALSTAAFISITGIIVPYLPTIKLALSAQNILELGTTQTIRFSADLFSYVIPSDFNPIWGNLFNTFFTSSYTGNRFEATHYLGIIPLLLVLFFGQRIPRDQKKIWFFVLIVFLVLSLGPRLHLLGIVTILPLPYALIDQIPFLDTVRVVARSSVMVVIAISVLLAWVLATQIKRRRLLLLLGALILIDFLFLPQSIQSARLSPVYKVISELPGQAMIEIPAATNYTAASRSLYASSEHHKEVIANIALERATGHEEFRYIKNIPALRQLLYLKVSDFNDQRLDFFGQNLSETLPDVLAFYDVKTILIHSDSLTAEQLTPTRSFLEQTLKVAPVKYEDAFLYTFNTETLTTDGIYLVRGEGWQRVGFEENSGKYVTELPNAAEIIVINTTKNVKYITLTLTISPKSHGNLSIQSQGKIVWDQTAAAGEQITASLQVKPGETTIEFNNNRSDIITIVNPTLEVQ